MPILADHDHHHPIQEERLHGIGIRQLVLGSGVLRAAPGRSAAAFGDVLRLRALGQQRGEGRPEGGTAWAGNVMYVLFSSIHIYLNICIYIYIFIYIYVCV